MKKPSAPTSSGVAFDADPVLLETLARQAMANGWPADALLSAVAEAVGPVSAPTGTLVDNDNASGASAVLHRIFREASLRSRRR